MSHKLLLALAIGVLVSACAVPLGRTVPECDSVTTSLVLQVQSVPGSAYVACVNGLKAGWDYRHLEAGAGRSVFWLDSDRWGDSFVTVESVLSCNSSGATKTESEDPSILLFKDIVSDTTVNVVVVPEGITEVTRSYAADIRAGLEDVEFNGRAATVSVSISNEPTASRVSAAVATGAHVITVSIRDAEEGKVTVILSGQPQESDGDLDEVIDAIEDLTARPSYRGTWYYVFEGGCVVYTFDAEGLGVDTIERDIDLALGLYDARVLRQVARDAGYTLP
jgi:hypothetical protein